MYMKFIRQKSNGRYKKYNQYATNRKKYHYFSVTSVLLLTSLSKMGIAVMNCIVRNTVELPIQAPGFYWNKCPGPPGLYWLPGL